MKIREKEIIEIATKLLAGMVANPHLYTVVSDEEGRGHQEQLLVLNAVRMAEALVNRIQSL
ncbi:MAG: hypothetical protein AAF635_13770 [Cyanobacteria bacterium P01_C01_bin.69]